MLTMEVVGFEPLRLEETRRARYMVQYVRNVYVDGHDSLTCLVSVLPFRSPHQRRARDDKGPRPGGQCMEHIIDTCMVED